MFEFLIDTLQGETLLGDLESVGACYPDDDVIYMFGIPCRLSSARPTPCAADGGESPLEDSPFETGIRRGAVVIPPAAANT